MSMIEQTTAYFQCRAICEKEAAVKICSVHRGAIRRSERLKKMAAVAYEDEETQDQIAHGDPYASDYHPNSESETDSDEHIVSLATTPIASGRGRQATLSEIRPSQVAPSAFCAGRRPCTPRPSRQVSQVCAPTGVCVYITCHKAWIQFQYIIW